MKKDILTQELAPLWERYEHRSGMILPALHIAQKIYGYVSDEAIRDIADALNVPPIQILETATFYTMYNRGPVGKYHIQICQNIACHLRGSPNIIETIENKLDIKRGETTADNRFTLNCVECLAACGGAPAIQINDTYYENLTPERVCKILDELPE